MRDAGRKHAGRAARSAQLARPRRRQRGRRCRRSRRRAELRALPAPRARDRHHAEDDQQPHRPGHRRHRRTRTSRSRRCRQPRRLRLPARAQGPLPRRRRREALPAPVPLQDARRPAVRHASTRSRPSSSRRSATRASRWAPGRPERPRGALRPVPARQGRLHARRRQLDRQPRRAARRPRAEPTQGERLQLTLDLGLQRAARQRAGQGDRRRVGNQAKAGAFVAMDPTNGEILALGSYPSFDANLLAKPISQSTYDRLTSQAQRRAAVQPRDRGRLSDRLDLQADHRDGRAGRRDHHAEHVIIDNGTYKLGTQDLPERQGRELRRAQPDPGDQGLLGHLLLQARRAGRRRRARSSSSGRASSASRARPGSTCPASSPASCPTAAGATRLPALPALREEGQGHPGHDAGAVRVRRHRAPLDRRATTSTSPSARATSRPRRCRWPRSTRRSSTAAPSSSRTWATRSRTAPGARSSNCARRPAAMSISPPPIVRRSCRGCTRPPPSPGGTSADIFHGFPVPDLRQDRHRRARTNPDQSWYAVYVDAPTKPIVVVRPSSAAASAPNRRRRRRV